MSSLPSPSHGPCISTILEGSSEDRKATAAPSTNPGPFPSLFSVTFKEPWDKIFTNPKPAGQDSQLLPKSKCLLDFRKLPKDLLPIILKFLEEDNQEATLNALARSNKQIYELANPLLYRNIRLRDLESSYLLLFTLISNPKLGMQTLSLCSEVQWFDCNPLRNSASVKAQWELGIEHMILGSSEKMRDRLLASNVFQSWDIVTAMLLVYIPNLKYLHLPRYFEAIDRGVRASMGINAAVSWSVKYQLELSKGRTAVKHNVPLLKLRVLNLLPDSPDAWNHFRARTTNMPSCFLVINPFLRIPTIKVLRTVLDEKVAGQQHFAPGTPTVQQHLREGAVRLEELELVARWKEFPGAGDYLRLTVEGLGKGSLKSFKLRWLDDNIYRNYLTWIDPANPIRIQQRIMKPREIGELLIGVGDTLEELVLPCDSRISMSVFRPFGPGIAFPKLRVLQGSLDSLFGRHIFGHDFSSRVVRDCVANWARNLPMGLERLVVVTGDGKVPVGLTGVLVEDCGWKVEEEYL